MPEKPEILSEPTQPHPVPHAPFACMADRRGWLTRHLPGFVLAIVACVAVLVPGRIADPELERACKLIGGSANTAYLTLGILTLIAFAHRRRCWRTFGRIVAVLLIVTAVIHVGKFVTGRCLHLFPRPSGNWGGFPSGHAATAFALAYLLTEWRPKFAVLWYLCAAIIAWSRLNAGAHFAYQIIAGILLGFIVVIALCFNGGRRSAP